MEPAEIRFRRMRIL